MKVSYLEPIARCWKRLKRGDSVVPDMENCTCESELELLQKHWNNLTDNQRGKVLEDLYECDCISTDVLDELTLKFDTPHVEDFNRPNIGLCLGVMEKMTPSEAKALETYMGIPFSEINCRTEGSLVLFFALSNFIARNYQLNLPALKVHALPDRFSIPFTIRKKTRQEL